MTYQDCLDRIFATFIQAKPFIIDCYDRDVRNPQRLLNIADQLGILPDPHKVIKVTGSKGKGTTSRMIAELLQKENPKEKIGLIISPEEIDHLDRMRINDQIISKNCFIEHASRILEKLPKLKAEDEYYSPYGLFLLIALSWFKEEKVDHMVIECGRGVRFDEGGQLSGKVGVVTSVFPEHLDKLGPTLEDVRQDKMSVEQTSDHLILGAQVKGQDILTGQGEIPGWFQACMDIAVQSTETYLGKKTSFQISAQSSSFGKIEIEEGGSVLYEAMVSAKSADRIFWQNLKNRFGDRLCVFLSLTDDKKFEEIETFFAALDIAVQHIILTGERGNLCYGATKNRDVFYTGDYENESGFRDVLMPIKDHLHAFVGTQTFVRLVKKAFAP